MTDQPVNLRFELKFRLYQLAGVDPDDSDLAALARVYGVSVAEIAQLFTLFRTTVDRNAARLRGIVPPHPPSEPYGIVAAGDSLTADRESYAAILGAYWDNSGRTIVNAGRSGDTTADLCGRIDRDVVRRNADHVILFIGTNDIGNPQVSFGEFADNMEFLLDHLLDAGKTVVQVTLPPADNDRIRRFFGDSGWGIDPSRLAEANDIIRSLSRRRGTLLVDFATAIVAAGIDPLLPDGLHLNGEGQLLLARLLARILP